MRRTRLLAVCALVLGLIPVAPMTASASTVVINEILQSTAGTDVEYVELYGTPGASLAGLSVIAVESSGTSAGNIYARLDFGAGDTLGDNGFFLWGTTARLETVYSVTPNADFAENTFKNAPMTFALVSTASLSGSSVTGAEVVVDAVATIDGSTTASYFGAPTVGPDGSYLAAGARRVVDGVDTDTAADWVMSDFSLGPDNTPTAGTGLEPPVPVVINEILYSTAGVDVEYVELYGTPGASLAGLSIIGVESSGAGVGGIDARLDFTADDHMGDNGFFLWGTVAGLQSNYGVTPNKAFPTNTFENSPTTFALVRTDSLSGSSVTGAESVIDTVATVDAGSDDTFFFGAPVVGPDGTYLPAGVRRAVDGVDTDTAADWVIDDFNLGPDNTPVAGTGLAPLSPCVTGGTFPISVIQGDGANSPCVGDVVTIEGVVVGDYEGSSPNLRGFYVQEEDADQDGNPATSEGIFVFHGNTDSVNVGDQVTVTGTVAEYQGQTQLGYPSSLVVDSTGNSVTPAEVSLPLSSADALEAVEGMLVEVPQTLYVTEMYQLGRFGQLTLSSGDRLDQPTAVVAPGAAANALQAANDLNRVILDDAVNDQNPDPIIFSATGTELTASDTIRGGDTVTGLTGVMTYTWAGNSASGNAYRIRPISPSEAGPDFEPANPRPTSPPSVGGSVQVATFNVLNYFLSFGTVCGPTQSVDCRGADNSFELERQRAKMLTAISKMDAGVVGLMELENTPGVSPEGDIVAGLNDALGDGTYAAVDAAAVGGGVVGTDAIRVGIIYQPAVVTPLGDPAILDYPLDPLGQPRTRSSVAQSFVENATGEVFTVVVNHFKSKGSSEIGGGICVSDPGYADCDQGDGQGFFNATRTASAHELLDWLATDPTGSGDSDVLIIGDLNSYAQEDPIGVLEAAGYVDTVAAAQADPYSYVFDGQWGYLDYILASPTIVGGVTDAADYHINSDEPTVLDYNTNFKSTNQVDLFYSTDEYRTSDHDPAIVGLDLASGFEVAATPDTLWPPNHKYRAIELSGTDSGGAALEVSVAGTESSEADSGLGEDDLPNDIVVTGEATLDLRAERFSTDGRVYTILVRATDGVQVMYLSTTVTVPHSQQLRRN